MSCRSRCLKFCYDETGADRVNRSGRHGNYVVCRHRVPHDQVGDRAVVDGVAQLLRRQASTKPEGYLGLGGGTQDVPGFGFAVWQAHRTRKRIVRMNLKSKVVGS